MVSCIQEADQIADNCLNYIYFLNSAFVRTDSQQVNAHSKEQHVVHVWVLQLAGPNILE